MNKLIVIGLVLFTGTAQSQKPATSKSGDVTFFKDTFTQSSLFYIVPYGPDANGVTEHTVRERGWTCDSSFNSKYHVFILICTKDKNKKDKP